MPSRDDLYQRYIVDLKQAEVLPREEELELARRYRDTRDPEAAERLVRGHLRLVVKIAIELDRKRAHLLDLVQEGNLGLLHAVEKYMTPSTTSGVASWPRAVSRSKDHASPSWPALVSLICLRGLKRCSL